MKNRLEEVIKVVEKEIPDSRLMLGSDPNLIVKWLPFDIDALDIILGGGLPFGRLSLITGNVSTGKTLLAQLAICSAQKRDLLSCFIDTERTFEPEWCKKTGVDLDKVIVSQPGGGEEALDTAIEMIRAGVDLVILDSVAALIPTAEVERSTEDFLVGAQARLFNKGLRKITQANREGKSIFVAINQTRASIGPMGIPLEESLPAGRGQKFFATVELRLTRGPYIKDEDNPKKRVGMTILCKTIKNKVHTPFQECTLPFRWDQGAIDTIAGLVQIALDLEIIKKRGANYEFEELKLYGKLRVIETLKNSPELVKRLKEVVFGTEERNEPSKETGDNTE